MILLCVDYHLDYCPIRRLCVLLRKWIVSLSELTAIMKCLPTSFLFTRFSAVICKTSSLDSNFQATGLNWHLFQRGKIHLCLCLEIFSWVFQTAFAWYWRNKHIRVIWVRQDIYICLHSNLLSILSEISNRWGEVIILHGMKAVI